MNFFITGATGFLGQYVLKEILKSENIIKANYRKKIDMRFFKLAY